MSQASRIEWTEATWNPAVGCTKISPGCKNCYAESMAKRLRAMGTPGYENGFKLSILPERLAEPLARKKPTVYFVNSMSDLFHKGVDDSYIAQVFDVIRRCPQHTFQVLTKRADRMATFFRTQEVPTNAWMGVSVEDRKYGVPRIESLRKVDARIRFLSVEPLLEDVGELELTDIQWVIVGGESGPKARPMKLEWVKNVRQQCEDQGVQFFFKQWGGLGGRRQTSLQKGQRPLARGKDLGRHASTVRPRLKERMTLKQYNWKDGPDLIQQHSVAKHRILEAYLAAYFRTLVSSPSQDVLRLTLVDGFAGGGRYVHNDTRESVKGSPFIFLEATREAEFLINKDRRKPVHLQVDYFFTEADRHAYMHLDKVLREEGYGDRIGNGIYIDHARFQDKVDAIIAFIKKKSPKNGRSIFALDQYGYREVPTHLLRKIFAALPSAEVILTFGVDSFMNFASDGDQVRYLLDGLGIPDIFGGRSVEEIKASDRDWRLFLQSTLYRRLVENCGARHFTPFFIRNRGGHGDYWLIHMSQHHRARDVMTEVHWANNNYFIHYGGAGLDMFQMVGYDPVHDADYLQQSRLGFEFDDVARRASIAALNEHIPRRVYADDAGISFGELFATTCNSSPATAQIYRESIGKLLDEKAVEIVGADGTKRRSSVQIKDSDQIMSPSQRRLFMAG